MVSTWQILFCPILSYSFEHEHEHDYPPERLPQLLIEMLPGNRSADTPGSRTGMQAHVAIQVILRQFIEQVKQFLICLNADTPPCRPAPQSTTPR